MKKNGNEESNENRDGLNHIYEPLEKYKAENLRKKKEYLFKQLNELKFPINRFVKDEKEKIFIDMEEFLKKNPNIKPIPSMLRNSSQDDDLHLLKYFILSKYFIQYKNSNKEILLKSIIVQKLRSDFLKKQEIENIKRWNAFNEIIQHSSYKEYLEDFTEKSESYFKFFKEYLENLKEKNEDVLKAYLTELNIIIFEKILLHIEYSFSNIYFDSRVVESKRIKIYEIFLKTLKNFKTELVDLTDRVNKAEDKIKDNYYLSFLSFLIMRDAYNIYEEEIEIWNDCKDVELKIEREDSHIFLKENERILKFDNPLDLTFAAININPQKGKDNIHKKKMESLKKIMEILYNSDGGIIIPKNEEVYKILYDIIFNQKVKVKQTLKTRIDHLIKIVDNNQEISYISNQDKKYVEVILTKLLYIVKDKEKEFFYLLSIKEEMLNILQQLLILNDPLSIKKELQNLLMRLIEVNKEILKI